jgi:hypothetical protein
VKPYDRHELALWAAWATAGIAGFAWLEWRGMRKRRDADPTLTAVVSRYVPGWLLALGWGAVDGWLHHHFRLAEASWSYGRPPDLPR